MVIRHSPEVYTSRCTFASSYPGTPSTEITEEQAKYEEIYCEWAPNEKVAMEAAFGASLAGKRAFCGMKHVGLNVAADPLFTMVLHRCKRRTWLLDVADVRECILHRMSRIQDITQSQVRFLY